MLNECGFRIDENTKDGSGNLGYLCQAEDTGREGGARQQPQVYNA